MKIFRSFRVLLVTAIMVINLCILPFAVGPVMNYVEQGYAIQFVDNARSTASLLSAQLSTMNVTNEQQKLSQYLTDLIGLGHLTYAKILPDNGPPILPKKLSKNHVAFVEDMKFGQHDDNMYFVAGPLFDSSQQLVGLFQFGFDESVTQYQMENAKKKIAFYAIFFFIASAIVVAYVAKKFTHPVAKLKDAANIIAAGDTDIKLRTKTSISELVSLSQSLEEMRTELVNHNKEMRSNQVYVSEIMNNMADSLIVIDEHWRVQDINWEGQKMFKCLREEILGKDFSNLFSVDLMEDMKKEIENNTQDTLCFEWAGCKERNICLYLEIKLSQVKLTNGNYIVCSARDMTIRKQTEEALLNAKINAEQANNAKSAFLSMISHELRTPLNAIIGYSDLMLEEAATIDKPHFIQDLRNIHASGEHLLSLINNILDISKIEAGKMKVNIDRFSVRDLLDEVLGTLQPVIEKNNNVFKANSDIYEFQLETDFFKLKQILINLINNAAKFTKDGEINLDMTELDSSYVEFSLRDTGIGISKSEIEHLFETFTQVDSSARREHEGTGLGLAISRKFSRLLGGDMRVESERGKGATFFVHLPIRHPDARKDVA